MLAVVFGSSGIVFDSTSLESIARLSQGSLGEIWEETAVIKKLKDYNMQSYSAYTRVVINCLKSK